MIYYFSGTGNSKWIAEEMAKRTEDVSVSLVEEKTPISIEGEVLGLVFPIYAWGVPKVVLDFIKLLEGKPSYTYAIATCGEEAGYAMRNLQKKLPLDACYTVVMPNNYVVGSNLEPEESVRNKITKAKVDLFHMADEVKNRRKVVKVKEGSFPLLKSTLIHFGFNLAARSTKPFYITDACISCGQCAKDCPAEAIEMREGKPVYVKDKCYMCTSCINRCPVEAIQYGKGTEKRGRYQFRDLT